jgi:hypothetical protein
MQEKTVLAWKRKKKSFGSVTNGQQKMTKKCNPYQNDLSFLDIFVGKKINSKISQNLFCFDTRPEESSIEN